MGQKKSQNRIGKSPSVIKNQPTDTKLRRKPMGKPLVSWSASWKSSFERKIFEWNTSACYQLVQDVVRMWCFKDFKLISQKKRAHTLSTSRNAITLLRPPQSWSLRNLKKGDPSLHDNLSKRWKQTKRKNFLKTKRKWKKTILVKIWV